MPEGSGKANRKKGARKMKSTGMRSGLQNTKKCAAYRLRESQGNTRKMRRIAKRIMRGEKINGYIVSSKGKAMKV